MKKNGVHFFDSNILMHDPPTFDVFIPWMKMWLRTSTMRKEEKEGCKRKEESRSERSVRVSVGGDVMKKVDEVKNLI